MSMMSFGFHFASSRRSASLFATTGFIPDLVKSFTNSVPTSVPEAQQDDAETVPAAPTDEAAPVPAAPA